MKMYSVTPFLRDRITVVWLGLVLATCLSWFLGTGHGFGPEAYPFIGVFVLAVAFVKMRFIGLDFMELRTAPLPLRAIFEAFVVVVFGALVVMFLTV